jgi:hypothetical protein
VELVDITWNQSVARRSTPTPLISRRSLRLPVSRAVQWISAHHLEPRIQQRHAELDVTTRLAQERYVLGEVLPFSDHVQPTPRRTTRSARTSRHR